MPRDGAPGSRSAQHDEAGAARRRVVVIASLTQSLVNFRLDLLREMVQLGHEVHAFAPENDAPSIAALTRIGVRFEIIPMARASLSPVGDLVTLFCIWRKLLRIRPNVLLPYTMKPIIYGLIAARLVGVQRRFALVTGLGWAFGAHGASWRRWLVRWMSLRLYGVALVGVQRVFVYNEADAEDILRARLVHQPDRVERIPGTGVNLEDFPLSEPPAGPPVFLMIARLLREKGVLDYVEAARRIRAERPGLRFLLVGPLDPNPSGLSRGDIDSWTGEGAIEYFGETRDVRPFLAACSVFVLPTYYREGVPRTILEALATGRAVVTTDEPGCRDTVIDGVNGWLTPARDVDALILALSTFAADEGQAACMGHASRRLAEERFDVRSVNRSLLDAMGLSTACGAESVVMDRDRPW